MFRQSDTKMSRFGNRRQPFFLLLSIGVIAAGLTAALVFLRPEPIGAGGDTEVTAQTDPRAPTREHDSTAITDARLGENRETTAGEVDRSAVLNRDDDHARNQEPCVDWARYFRSSEAHAVDSWLLSWGALPAFDQSRASRPYASYNDADLKSLASSGDRHAMHTLALNKLWRALTGDARMPDYVALWNAGDENHPFAKRVPQRLLEEARAELYEAAVHGNLGALTDISLSYALEAQATRDDISEERRRDLRLQAAIYADVVPTLIEGLTINLVHVRIDESQRDIVDRSRETIIEQFREDRVAAGFDPDPGIVLPDEVRQSATRCFDDWEL